MKNEKIRDFTNERNKQMEQKIEQNNGKNANYFKFHINLNDYIVQTRMRTSQMSETWLMWR